MLFESLPLLESIVRLASPVIESRFSRTILISVQHLLATTGSLFESLILLGFRPERMFVLGKAYSSNSEVAEKLRSIGVFVDEGSPPASPGGFQDAFCRDVECLWERVLAVLLATGCDEVVILDDGGRCLSSAPEEVFGLARVSGVEQTTSGLSRLSFPHRFRVVEVATSAAKRILEAPMISRAVLRRLPQIEGSTCCGIVGVGNIGGAVIRHLLQRKAEVIAFDQIPERSGIVGGARPVSSLAELVLGSNMIIGCSGDDIFATNKRIEWRCGETTLISCSSEDREFKSLLVHAALDGSLEEWSPFGVAIVRRGSASLKILRGGFPTNFDGSVESVPAREIQLTRALLLGGILQAVFGGDGSSSGSGRMLDPKFQARVVQIWLRVEPECSKDFSDEVICNFSSEGWISWRSGGVLEDVAGMRSVLDLG